MTRRLLTWIGLAILGLGAPRATHAAELHPGGEPTSLAPSSETPSKGALAPERSTDEAVQAAHVTPFAPAGPAPLSRALAYTALQAGAPRRSAPTALPRVLPDARAPPA